jgi:hypothetical protein
VVGTSLTAGDAEYRPFLYDRGTMYDLHELVVDRPIPFPMWDAADINDFGQIVGINYLLDPLYESIAPGREFAFRETLGRRLTFEYWFAPGDVPALGRRARALVEVRIEGAGFGRSRFRECWRPVGVYVQGAADGHWRTAAIVLPPQATGKEATVRVRVRAFGDLENSTVYLRHFGME